MTRRARTDERRLTASEADRIYRLRHGTAAKAWRAGLIHGDQRRGRGFAGKILLLDPKDCARVLPGLDAQSLLRQGIEAGAGT